MINKNKIWLSISIIVFLSIILFFTFNIGLFNYHKQIIKEGSPACQNKNINDACSFYLKNKKISGTCQANRNNTTICRPN
ncbi:MAG: hypothetical protein COV57_00305 [Candidatus Liptonbacteria bacterium CG11_big_fil_rev_8_21_14_0_20_35_14]|uniref:Uncharacterized protein n=1 Tax=Candidatus Liptonbacteria bacterium CG11_big_fil_rev_8_21_14_0_20_35_14 TaxID=1974634 RepID=A0A2H0N8J8_9BACT|nr:MAG: hypothetical protein COV57_00305 [Candidatus Liptonbacteria bacterium CG11_big_fil_rev_8_21_14_0_20_35_14]